MSVFRFWYCIQYSGSLTFTWITAVTANEIQHHASALLQQNFSLILAIGNIDGQRAIELGDLAQNIFGSLPLPNPQMTLERALILPEGLYLFVNIAVSLDSY
jgi:hypothetical protein